MSDPLTIVLPPPNAATGEYVLPPNLIQYVQSVYAEIDNSGGGDARPVLTVADQSGAVIAKKRQGESIPAGDSGSATWALRLTDEAAAAAAAAGLSYATIARQSVDISPGAAFQPVDTTGFATNDPATFVQDSSGTPGHSGGVLIQSQGVYLAWAWAQAKVPFGGGPEPDASWMSVRAFSYDYPASQFTWQPSDAGSQAKKGQRFNPGQQWWSMYDTDTSYYPASDVTVPTQEYHVEVYNAGTQDMNFRAALTVLRLGDAVGGYPP